MDAHPYQFDESIFHLRGVWCTFFQFWQKFLWANWSDAGLIWVNWPLFNDIICWNTVVMALHKNSTNQPINCWKLSWCFRQSYCQNYTLPLSKIICLQQKYTFSRLECIKKINKQWKINKVLTRISLKPWPIEFAVTSKPVFVVKIFRAPPIERKSYPILKSEKYFFLGLKEIISKCFESR